VRPCGSDQLVLSLQRATRFRPQADALPPVPWRDPHGVSPADLAVYIRQLEEACLANPIVAMFAVRMWK